MNPSASLIPIERIERNILFIRGEKVMLDADLAELYGVETKVLNQAVRRNLDRFPKDFCFRLNKNEAEMLNRLRSQTVTLKRGQHRKYSPFVFTEQGVAMLSGVLHSPRAVQVNIEIMRAFVQLRRLLATNAGLARKLSSLEKKYDAQFKIVFDAIRQLMTPSETKRREIGFHVKYDDEKPGAKKISAAKKSS